MADDDEPRDLTEQLFDALSSADVKCTYSFGGELENVPLPGLHVENVGRIALPLMEDQAAKLHAVSEVAPFGRGSETVVDETVRKARQIDAAQVQLSANWNAAIERAVLEHLEHLGVTASVEAKLYKLVIYETGGFFKRHQDSEKEPGMFGSFVVQLPAGHEGGSLAVRHRGKEKVFDFSASSDERFFATSFYADCEHELRPVTNGRRICLIYNLVRTGVGPAPPLLTRDKVIDDLVACASVWEADEEGPEKLAWSLEHQYTEKNLSFGRLKGKDAAVVELLLQSGKFEVHLALITKHQSGDASIGDYSYRRYSYDDSDDDDDGSGATMEEVHEESIETSLWVAEDGSKPKFAFQIDVESEMIEDEPAFDEDADPDKTAFEGYQGNYGPTLEYWYYKAVVVIWPKRFSLEMYCESDFGAAVALVRRRAAAREAARLEELQHLVAFAMQKPRKAQAHRFDLLNLCLQMEQYHDGTRLLSTVATEGVVTAKHQQTYATAIQALGWSAIGEHVLRAVQATPPDKLSFVASLVAALGGEPQRAIVHAAAEKAAARAAALQASKPKHSWRQAHANVPGHQDATSFLRGPTQTYDYYGPGGRFSDSRHAHNFAAKHFNGVYNAYEKHSASSQVIQPGGRGSAWVVRITKTSHAYQAQLAQYEEAQKELRYLQPLLHSEGEPSAQRQRVAAAGSSHDAPIELDR